MKQKAYAAVGVDIDLGNQVKATLPQLLAATHRREVLGKVGGFGGLFALDLKKYRKPVLVSWTASAPSSRSPSRWTGTTPSAPTS
jgi:phosphoribosylformylglycinamidine cyclo-ligase